MKSGNGLLLGMSGSAPWNSSRFTSKQQAFLDFVLAHYVQEGVEELDQSKLGMLLNLQYGAISDAILNLGAPEEICSLFVGFQKYLYQPAPE